MQQIKQSQMKKKLKPEGPKGRFSFLNKQTIFRNLLKNTISKFNDHYRIDFDNSSYSDISGDLHFLLHERPYQKHSLRTMDLFYRRSTHEVTLTSSKSVLPKSLNPGGEGIAQTLKKGELHSVSVKSRIIDWFKNDRVPGYKFHVTFKTEFPLFDYNKTLYVESTGSTLAKDIVDDIFGKEAMSNRPTEMDRFRQAFRSARHMCDCTLHCSVVSLATDREVEHNGNMMATEIGNQIYRMLTPPIKPDNIVNRRNYYWETVVNFFSSLFSRGRKIPSY